MINKKFFPKFQLLYTHAISLYLVLIVKSYVGMLFNNVLIDRITVYIHFLVFITSLFNSNLYLHYTQKWSYDSSHERSKISSSEEEALFRRKSISEAASTDALEYLLANVSPYIMYTYLLLFHFANICIGIIYFLSVRLTQ